MGASCLRCPKIGPTTRGQFSGSPPPKPRKNAHMNRSSLELFFFAKNQVSGRDLAPRLINTSEKVENFYPFSLKTSKKNRPEIGVWSWIPVMVIFGGLENYSRSVFHAPLPCL